MKITTPNSPTDSVIAQDPSTTEETVDPDIEMNTSQSEAKLS